MEQHTEGTVQIHIGYDLLLIAVDAAFIRELPVVAVFGNDDIPWFFAVVEFEVGIFFPVAGYIIQADLIFYFNYLSDGFYHLAARGSVYQPGDFAADIRRNAFTETFLQNSSLVL